MTTVPAETLETLDVREHVRRTGSDAPSRFHLIAGFDGSAVEDTRSSQCSPAGLEGRAVTNSEPIVRTVPAVPGGEDQ
jgi:hypothetical protein